MDSATLERDFSLLAESVRKDERLRDELDRSRSEFFGAGAASSPPPQALRRHLEWFLLERPSGVLGGVPIQVLEADSPSILRQSFAGVFEVSAASPDGGLWVRDLSGLGEYPVIETEAAGELAAGDLLVGRLFAADGGAFLLSPAMGCFRSPPLLGALRRDLDQMRHGRRGVLRMQQSELERLFFAPGHAWELENDPAGPARRAAREALESLGIEDREVERLLAVVGSAAASGDGGSVMELLNELAFDTGVDLEVARRALTGLWAAERQRTRPDPASGNGHPLQNGVDARQALAAFDRGRAEGKDLEQLFSTLERDLGVEGGEAEEEDSAGAPDFPGVVGAMIEEFLWETELELGPESARALAGVRLLGAYGKEIGVFEELDARHLVDFACRWLLDEGGLGSAREAEEVMHALADFCRWCETWHAHPLWQRFGPAWEDLSRSVPRLFRCRQESPPVSAVEAGAYRIERLEARSAVLESSEGDRCRIELTAGQREHLEEGDLARIGLRDGVPALGPVYPRQVLDFLP